jgi:hypothetical protein
VRDYAGKLAGGIIMESELTHFRLYPANEPRTKAEEIGLRFGDKGTHTSRTMMLAELEAVLEMTEEKAERGDYTSAIIDANCLSKATAATRRLSSQRLSELYGLEPGLPLFRVLRRLWNIDQPNRPRLALLAAIARDPLLAASASSIISLAPGAEFQREPLKAALRSAVGYRLNDSTLEKVRRNAASSWTQSEHLEGRTFKKRRLVQASPSTAAFALYLAHAAGFRGAEIFSSTWFRLLDCDPSQARRLALEAKRLGLINLRMAGDVVELDVTLLDPASRRI